MRTANASDKHDSLYIDKTEMFLCYIVSLYVHVGFSGALAARSYIRPFLSPSLLPPLVSLCFVLIALSQPIVLCACICPLQAPCCGCKPSVPYCLSCSCIRQECGTLVVISAGHRTGVARRCRRSFGATAAGRHSSALASRSEFRYCLSVASPGWLVGHFIGTAIAFIQALVL